MNRDPRPMGRRSITAIGVAGFLVVPMLAAAQSEQVFPTVQVLQSQATAVRKLALLGVQQAISLLPPSSAQSVLFEYDPDVESYRKSLRPGPTAFRTPYSLAAGTVNARVA